MDIDQHVTGAARAFDGTTIYPLGKDVFIAVQWFNGGLSYVIRVSDHNVFLFMMIMIG